MTTMAPSPDRIVTFRVPDFPDLARIVTFITGRRGRSVERPAIPEPIAVTDLTTVPGVRADGHDWLVQSLRRLDSVAGLSPDWDGEGSLPPDAQIVASAANLLQYLQRDDVPVPFICPIAGGSIQLEWSLRGREVEMELLDERTVAFLRAEETSAGPQLESGEYSITDINKSRELLDWIAAA